MSIQLSEISLEGKALGQIEVSEAVFGVSLNRQAVYLALRQERINAMRGTANSKTRGEVSGGGRKPWKQKGTGRARAGSIRSPLWKGGGVTFGPKPRFISIKQNKKLVALAHRCVLSHVVPKMSVMDFASVKEAKTSVFASFLKANGVAKSAKVLVLYGGEENAVLLKRMTANINTVKVSSSQYISVQDLLSYPHILITKDAIQTIHQRLGGL
jgi:large subunit ribosomal protein L4